MMARQSLDAEVELRLSRDCAEHEHTIASLLEAHQQGLLDADLVFRHCALELHSVKGVAGVLELHAVVGAIGPLCDVMLRQNPTFSASFLDEFGSWFQLLIRCLRASAKGGCDAGMLREVRSRQNTLLSALTPRPLPGTHAGTGALKVSPSSGRRLLIVDDSATICAALSAQLRDRGYPVCTARTLAETAEALASFEPEIVVSDVHMPEVEGDELCRRIKAQMTRIVPVVLYSIMPVERLAEIARAAGADAYVHKGLGVGALIERMDELLSDEILF